MHGDPSYDITSLDTLLPHFGSPPPASLYKELDHLDENYQALIRASPFVALATLGEKGLDCTPRGDPKGFVRVLDDKTLVLPERKGNNRVDSLRNLLIDPRISLLFLIPGVGETLRVAGRARISADPALLDTMSMNGKPPTVAIVMTVEKAYFQCSRAVVRADLWNPASQVARDTLPSTGTLVSTIAARRDEHFDGVTYDKTLDERVRTTLY
jgi:PPOX class probable FMN-dependent enzyme